jgi:hypothetical protein
MSMPSANNTWERKRVVCLGNRVFAKEVFPVGTHNLAKEASLVWKTPNWPNFYSLQHELNPVLAGNISFKKLYNGCPY